MLKTKPDIIIVYYAEAAEEIKYIQYMYNTN